MRLKGRTILITRSPSQATEFRQLLEAHGARVLAVPTIAIQPRQDETVAAAVSDLARYDWVIFTSTNAVNVFLDQLPKPQLAQWQAQARPPEVAAVGPATARSLHERGLKVDLTPDNYRAEGVVKAFQDLHPQGLKGVRMLFPAAAGARQVIPEQLRKLGGSVDFVPVYDTVVPGENRPQLLAALAQEPDLIAVTSPSTLHHLVAMASGDVDLNQFRYAAIGPVTARAVQHQGFELAVVPSESTVPALAQAMLDYFAADDGRRS